MKITKLHREVAEALFRERLTPAAIRAKFRVSPKTLARWRGEPAFRAVLAEIEAECQRRARWLLVTFGEPVAARLIKLTEAENAETARKACLDVLVRALGSGAPPEEAERPAEGLSADAPARQEFLTRVGALAEEVLAGDRTPSAESPPAAPVAVPQAALAASAG